ncbi:hypothetical protein AUJ46_01820 [Candidatus Peregrinibacteria bacterium CG1_02_54_53]|nr:MAG: hypothetical protein AUJ46_01820 [Candidatus Peregrinibacteria bacterium CG1_02_54_53]
MEGISPMAHRNTPPPANGYDALLNNDVYVTKIGGDNAGKLASNANIVHRRAQNMRTQILAVSAIRSSHPSFSDMTHPFVIEKELATNGKRKPGFNTTSHLIAIARALARNDRPAAEDMAGRISAFTRSIVDGEVIQDGLMEDRERTRARLQGCITRTIDDPDDPHSLQSLISNAHPAHIRHVGEDWLLTEGNHSQSITGIGERLAQSVTRTYFEGRNVPSAELDNGDEQTIYSMMWQGDVSGARGQLCENLRQSLQRTLSSRRVLIAGGYAPPLGTERGYSDKTGALIAHVVHQLGQQIVYLIEKAKPIMSADPNNVHGTRVIPNMTPFLAKELFGNARGADAGALHPEALDMLAEDDIPIVVLNAEEEPAPHNTTLIQAFNPEPNGVEIVHSRSVPFALQIVTGKMIGQTGFEEDIARWFAEHNVSIQHIATSEGSISYTFDNGKESAATVAALRQHVHDRYGVNGEEVIQAVDHLAVVYCLGNDMRTPGQAEKATFALHGAGVNIRMITQGLNQSVMAFLVDKDDASRAVQALHDIFITLPDGVYRILMDETRLRIAGAVTALRQQM